MSESHENIRFAGEAEFASQVLDSPRPVLAVFLAPWSRPCRIMDSVFADVAATYAGSVSISKINADENPYLSLSYDVQFIPTVLCFVGGYLRERVVGTTSKRVIMNLLDRWCDCRSREALPAKGTPA